MQLYDRCIRSVAQVQQVKSNRPGRKREFCKREIYTYLYKIYIQMAAVRCNNALRALSWSWGAFSSEPGVSSGNMHATRNSSGVSRVEEESTAVSLYKSPRRHHFHYIIITWSDRLRVGATAAEVVPMRHCCSVPGFGDVGEKKTLIKSCNFWMSPKRCNITNR